MGKYKIQISYATGNSFGSEDCYDDIELTWENLELAKENLQRIKEHYEFYQFLNSYSSRKEKKEAIISNREKPWFAHLDKLFHVEKDFALDEKAKKKLKDDEWEYRSDPYTAEHCLVFEADNGNKMQMRAFWCGYFEQLYGAEVIVLEDSGGMKFEL